MEESEEVHEKSERAAATKLSFKEARSYVRTLGLLSSMDWKTWSASGQRPANIPASPHQFYKDRGWAGYKDFLHDPVQGDASTATTSQVLATPSGARSPRRRPAHKSLTEERPHRKS